MNETKPGYKTTEFWLTLLSQTVGILTLTGVIKPEEATPYLQGGGAVIGGLMTIIPQIAYAFSRGKAKAAAVTAAKALLILLLPALLLAAPAPASAAVEWVPANQVTVAWDAVTTDANGNPIPAAEIRYVSYYVAEADTAKTAPITIGTTTALEQVFTFQGEGRFILGVKAERVVNTAPAGQLEQLTVVGQSPVSWSDNPAVCLDGKTFGVTRYASPHGPVIKIKIQ
jgi:hypothetical protein